jgi:hypothetical protein
MTETIGRVGGFEIRVSDVYPKEIIGVDNGRYVMLFWEGLEVARIVYPTAQTQVTIERKVTV